MKVVLKYPVGNVDPVQVHLPHVVLDRKTVSGEDGDRTMIRMKILVRETGLRKVIVQSKHHMALVRKYKGKIQITTMKHSEYAEMMQSRFL